MKKRFIVLSLLILAAVTLVVSEPFIMYPAVSPDGNKVAFMCEGDIWVHDLGLDITFAVTRNSDYDYRPVWSPDGKSIAFTSNRDGNYEIYAVEMDGGYPRRLTFHSDFDTAFDWNEDGYIYAGSYRDPRGKRLYRLSPETGEMEMVVDYPVYRGKVSRGGSIAFFTDNTSFWRKTYKGSAACNLLLMEKTGTLTELSVTESMETFPSWAGDHALYYLTNESGMTSAASINVKSGEKKTLFSFPGGHMDQLSTNRNGKFIAFISGFRLYIYDITSGEYEQIKPRIPADSQAAPESHYIIGNNSFDEAEISPDGKRIVFVARGDLVYKDLKESPEKGEVTSINLTDSPWVEYDVVWDRARNSIAYVSSESGDYDIWTMDLDTGSKSNIKKSEQEADGLAI